MDDSAAATPVSQPPLATELQQESFNANLRTFSDSLGAFQQCFNDLQRHIDSIRTSINSMLLPPHTNITAPAAPAPAPEPEPEPEPSWESDPSEYLEEEEEEVEGEEKEVEKQEFGEGEGESEGEKVKSPRSELEIVCETTDNREGEGEEVKSSRSELKLPRSELEIVCQTMDNREGEGEGEGKEVKSPRSELEIFCERMDYRRLRKYMIAHISDFQGLREQVTKALRLTPNPAKFVFKCLGKFYLKGVQKNDNDSPLFLAWKAKVLLLECFLLMTTDKGGVEIEKWVKDEAEQAALTWLERMNSEGVKPQEIDARGLVFLIGCFGIPDKFTNANIRNLLQVSNLKWLYNALGTSIVIMTKVQEIIEEMVANNAVVKAVNIVCSFGMQDKFNPKTLLTTFVRESKKSFDSMNGSQGAQKGNIGVKRKYFDDLKSVNKCLKRHEIDPSEVLPGWEINKEIMSLQKEIAEFNKQIADQKIAQQNAELHKRKLDGTLWLSNKEVKHSHFPNPWLPQHQRVVNAISNNTLFEGGGTAGHNYGYFMPPLVFHGPVAGSIHANIGYSLAGPVGGVAIGGPGGHGGSRVDSIPGQMGSHAGQLYGYAHRPSTYFKGPNTIPGDSNRPSPYLEVSPGLPNTITSNAYRPAPSMESSKGLPNTIPGDANRPPP